MLKGKSSRERFSIKNTLNVITQIENIHKFLRSSTCEMLLKDFVNEVCRKCQKKTSNLKYEGRKKGAGSLEPATLKVPVSITSPERLVLTLKQQRLKTKELEENLAKMQLEIEKSGQKINETLKNDLISLYSKEDSNYFSFYEIILG